MDHTSARCQIKSRVDVVFWCCGSESAAAKLIRNHLNESEGRFLRGMVVDVGDGRCVKVDKGEVVDGDVDGLMWDDDRDVIARSLLAERLGSVGDKWPKGEKIFQWIEH